MKRTVLDMVQSILNDTDADQVNSINDTTESEQVSIVLRDSYFDIIDRRDWADVAQLVQLENSGTTDRPTHIAIPDDVKKLLFINYDVAQENVTRKQYQPVGFLYPDEFLFRTNQRNTDDANVDIIIDISGTELLISNDNPPRFWTTFDDKNLVFDSYDKAVDSTIVAAKVQAQAYVTPKWEMTDTFIPVLPEKAFTLLVEEAKSAAFIVLKQMVNEKAESRARKHDRYLSRKDWALAGGVRYPNYGRGRSGSTFRRQPLEKNDPTPTS